MRPDDELVGAWRLAKDVARHFHGTTAAACAEDLVSLVSLARSLRGLEPRKRQCAPSQLEELLEKAIMRRRDRLQRLLWEEDAEVRRREQEALGRDTSR